MIVRVFLNHTLPAFLYNMYILKEAEEHLQRATMERSLYRSVCKRPKEQVRKFFKQDDNFVPPQPGARLPPCSANITSHYSSDMAQQVHYPADFFQPVPQEKGQIPIISLLHYHYSVHGLTVSARQS